MTDDQATAEAAVPPATQKVRKVRGIIYLDMSRCKGCGFCIAFCPPKVLEFSDEYNAQGYHPPRLVNPDGCTGCDLCGLYCPDFAIYGVMLKYAPPATNATAPQARQELSDVAGDAAR